MTATLYVGDVYQRMAQLEDHSFDLIITSPPFFNLRSYLPDDHPQKHLEIGSEQTPADWMDTMLALTAEWRRLLAPHGSIAVEIGDTYANSGGAGGDYNEDGLRDGQPRFRQARGVQEFLAQSLMGVPHAYALSLTLGRNIYRNPAPPSPAGQWIVRNYKSWIRSNPPVGALGRKERPATSYITVACLRTDRWFDLDAVRTPYTALTLQKHGGIGTGPENLNGPKDGITRPGIERGVLTNPGGAPPLDWWHQTDATIDRVLNERAALRPQGKQKSHGPKARRGREANALTFSDDGDPNRSSGARGHHIRRALEAAGILPPHPDALDISPRGYSGAHYAVWPPELVKQLVLEMCPPRGTVLDPFVGSGTTLMVCEGIGRNSVGIDLDPRSADLARERCGMFLDVIEANEPYSPDEPASPRTPGGAQQSA